MQGPFAIICRGHSGSRLLCEAFRQNGFWMGLTENKTRDSKEFTMRDPVVAHLIQEAFRYPQNSSSEKAHLQEQMRKIVNGSKNNCPDPDAYIAYGWKQPRMTFTVQIFLEAFPESKIVHLIRDGRDVMLSRSKSRVRKLHDAVNRLMLFGDADVSQYRGMPLTKKNVKRFRNEFEMDYWVHAVRFGMRGRMYKDQYMEIFYEDLCTRPVETLTNVFEFLRVPFKPEVHDWIINNASTERIGKWKKCGDEINEAIQGGEPLLRELGYL